MNRTKRKLVAANLAALLAVGGVVGYTISATAAPAPLTVSEPAPVAGKKVGAATPEKLLALLGERIVAKDVEGIIALHEPEAAIVDWDGSVVRGHAAIRKFYLAWFESDPVLTVNPLQTVEAGGKRNGNGKIRLRTASVMGDYHLEQDAADGTRESFTGNFCDIVQQQPDGSWLYINDNPYPPHGDAAAPAARHHH